MRTAKAQLQQWEEKAAFEAKVRGLEGRLQDAIDVHDEGSLKVLLAEADELGVGGDNAVVKQGRALSAEWESEQQEWKDVLAQRTDVIKLVKSALGDGEGEVTIAQVRCALYVLCALCVAIYYKKAD